MTGIAKAQTIKQAKASFAARGRPSLNAKEQRQLERSLELEQRAEKAKEQEKRRAAAAKKRAENDGKNKAERERAFLGTQMRKDKFGYKSSQFHLGAFLMGGKKAAEKEVIMKEPQANYDEDDDDDDMFGDEDLDDEVMLNALDAPLAATKVHSSEHAKSDSAVFVPPPPTYRRSQSAPPRDAGEDLIGDFWDDLESSTQIARELGETGSELAGKTASTRSASFGSVDFDLTAEDLDQLNPPSMVQQQLPSRREMMPPPPPPALKAKILPPAVPARQTGQAQPALLRHLPVPTHVPVVAPPARSAQTIQTPARSLPRMAPPSKPAARSPSFPNQRNVPTTKQMQPKAMPPPPPQPLRPPVQSQTKPRNAIKGPFLPASSLYCSPELGFTLTQLETFVDDDIQLTQAVPG